MEPVLSQSISNFEFESLYKYVFNSIYAGVSITDEKGYFLAINDNFCKLYGRSHSELINQHFTILIPEEHRELAMDLHMALINGTIPEIHDDWHVERSDGSFVDVYSTPRLLINNQGEKFKVTTVVDITEYKRFHPCEG